MISYFLSKIISMCFGLLYPAYCSYKAVKTKNVKEYVHWMMYWIVFSLFSFFEVFVDIFVGCWFPFYYELKIVFILWMLSPTTRGGSVLYRRIIHPMFTRHESEIDAYLADFKYHASNLVVRWGTSAFNYLTEMVMNTILRAGSDYAFLKQKKGSFSFDGYDEQDMNRNTHLQRTDSDVYYSDAEGASSPDSGETRQQRRGNAIDRNKHLSEAGEMNRFNGLPKPYSMMNLGNVEADAASKVRSSSRKKKELGNYAVVASQDMTMPIVFGWYPPPSVAPDLNSASLCIQPSMLPPLMSPHSTCIEKPVEVASSERLDGRDRVQMNLERERDDDELIHLESNEADDFFDCETDTDLDDSDGDEDDDGRPCTNRSEELFKSPTSTLQSHDDTEASTEGREAVVPASRTTRSTRSNERDLKRNSLSTLQSKSYGISSASSSSSSSSSADKSKIRKSISNNDLKLVKPASIWTTSGFKRVLNPFTSSSPAKSSSATNLKRTSSNASRTSVNSEKKRKAESSRN